MSKHFTISFNFLIKVCEKKCDVRFEYRLIQRIRDCATTVRSPFVETVRKDELLHYESSFSPLVWVFAANMHYFDRKADKIRAN